MTNMFTIRREQPGDEAFISSLIEGAFRDHPHSDQTEHLIVQRLRESNSLSLSLVAEREHQLIGHIAFSPVKINDELCDWYGLGPVAVSPAYQRKGVGSELIRVGLATLQSELQAKGCVLLGDPEYYRRFGFSHSTMLQVPGFPQEYFMTISFKEGTPNGEVEYNPAYFGD
ncbi:GNAT family N-acetyltransferase [Polystyrenella longa]|nr:N-acetyltransferase [Polystyrenella longa]